MMKVWTRPESLRFQLTGDDVARRVAQADRRLPVRLPSGSMGAPMTTSTAPGRGRKLSPGMSSRVPLMTTGSDGHARPRPPPRRRPCGRAAVPAARGRCPPGRRPGSRRAPGRRAVAPTRDWLRWRSKRSTKSVPIRPENARPADWRSARAWRRNSMGAVDGLDQRERVQIALMIGDQHDRAGRTRRNALAPADAQTHEGTDAATAGYRAGSAPSARSDAGSA